MRVHAWGPRRGAPVLAVVIAVVCAVIVCNLAAVAQRAVSGMRSVPPLHAPIVIAHRGDADAPENSLRAIRDAGFHHADYAEIDVRLTSDGVPVVFHDRYTGRLSAAGRNLKVSKLTLERLRSMPMRQRGVEFRVPTLRQALAEANRSDNGLGLLLDIKTDDRHADTVAGAVIRVIDRAPYDHRLMVMSLSRRAVRIFKQRRPHWQVGLCASGRPSLIGWGFGAGPGGGSGRGAGAATRDGGRGYAPGAGRDGRSTARVAARGDGTHGEASGGGTGGRTGSEAGGRPDLAMDFVVLRGREITNGFLAAAHARGVPVYAGAVNDYRTAIGLLRHGVSGFLGNATARLREAISDYDYDERSAVVG